MDAISIQNSLRAYTSIPIEAKEKAASTSWKTHSLIILSNFLLAIGIALSSATLVMATVIHPMLAVATPIVPLALGILGLRSAVDDSSSKESGPTHTLITGAPIGIRNEGGLDCWLNSAFQCFGNIPSYLKMIKKNADLPANLSRSSILGWLKGEAISTALETYVEESKAAIRLRTSSLNSLALRQALSKIKPEVAERDSGQKDPIIAFEAVHAKNEDYLPIRQRYDSPTGPSETDQKAFCIDFQLIHGQKNAFGELFNGFFDDGPRKKWFTSSPDGFLVQARRTSWQPDGTTAKIGGPLDFPLHLKLTKEQCPSAQDEYHVDAFIVHLGSSIDSGHYVTYLYKEGLWWEANDAVITTISEAKAKEKLAEAYIVHYGKRNWR